LYKVGDVLKWIDFPLPDDEKSSPKPRWFISLGEIKDGTHCAIMCTPTTQLQYYEEGEKRSRHPIIRIKAGRFGFESDCILDLKINLIYRGLTPEIILKCQENIHVVTNIRIQEENLLREIYNKILKSGHPPVIVQDIHDSYNLAGITKLQKPKKRN
jgi:hypothetical protein